MKRRTLILGAAAWPVAARLLRAGPAAATAALAEEAAPFDPAQLRERARRLAQRPYRDPRRDLPFWLDDIDYDEYLEINFRPERALWTGEGLPYGVEFFQRGYLFKDSVVVNEVRGGQAREVLYAPDLFDFGSTGIRGATPSDLGFAGFRLTAPLNRSDRLEEFLVFLGASYFRALAAGLEYGVAARGIALDTGGPDPEEFPAFHEVWIEKPAPGAAEIVVHALLDGPSIAGAYRIAVRTGITTATVPATVPATVAEVTASLFPRRAIETLGVAPLTSMYMFGENHRNGIIDYRPEVHDSDGLSLCTGTGDWVWRPLGNPQDLTHSRFPDENPRGFGLLQRDRAFTSYEDLQGLYHLRPGLWVEPLEPFGKGRVELVEIPTDREWNDNIVAFWVPDEPVEPGRELSYRYRLTWSAQAAARPALAWPALAEVVATRVGASIVRPDVPLFVLDFAGGQLGSLTDSDPVNAAVTISHGTLAPVYTQRNTAAGGWRVLFEVHLDDNREPMDMTCVLRLGERPISERWVYRWSDG